MNSHAEEVAQGKRYEFGKNWQRFLRVVDDERIEEAERSLKTMLRVETLEGESFLDVGSGSGLFSLAAMRLGAARVHSFDYDPQSVACTRELKRRCFPKADQWSIDEASVLDMAYLNALGQFDVVYSWGVLHHTGRMWQALRNVATLVNPGGCLFIAIYNDQGKMSRMWTAVKIRYLRSPASRLILAPLFFATVVVHGLALDLCSWTNPFARYRQYRNRRGMSFVPDLFDWLGGYPFEYATPDQIFDFYRERHFTLATLKTCGGGRGNNQYVFVRAASSPDPWDQEKGSWAPEEPVIASEPPR